MRAFSFPHIIHAMRRNLAPAPSFPALRHLPIGRTLGVAAHSQPVSGLGPDTAHHSSIQMTKHLRRFRHDAARPPAGARAVRYILRRLGYDIDPDDAELVAYYAEPLIWLVLNHVYPLPSRSRKRPQIDTQRQKGSISNKGQIGKSAY